jgi:protein TonB
MANTVLTPNDLRAQEPASKPRTEPELNLLLSRDQFDQSLWRSLRQQIHERLHPEKLPPLQLTSRPVPVKSIWGDYNYKKRGATGSAILHVLAISAIVGFTLYGRRIVKAVEPHEDVQLIAPDPGVYMPMQAKAVEAPSGGGGGGGDRDKLVAPQGKLPKQSLEQIAPPQAVIRNPLPKLPVEPSVVIPPSIQLANNNLPNLGDPKSAIPSGPPSNGIGSGGGIGSGAGGGIGSGLGPGVGPGSGGGTGGGVFRVGGGVSAPKALYTPDPEYSEEARKAKYQGTVVLWLIVGPDGRPQQVKVARTLGMGLDQKAIEAVRNWRFEPAKLNGNPVAVQINVEVKFRLY